MVKDVKVSTFRWQDPGARPVAFNGRIPGFQTRRGPGRLHFDDGTTGPRADYASAPIDVPAGHIVTWSLRFGGDPYNCSVYRVSVLSADAGADA